MSRIFNKDESCIPDAIRRDWEMLFIDFSILKIRWQNYRELFAEEEIFNLLHDVAPHFFQYCEDIFRDDLMSQICRLNDEPGGKGKRRATLKRLFKISVVEKMCDDDSLIRLKKLMDDAARKAEPFRQHRNKRISHSDLKYRQESFCGSTSLPGVSRKQIGDAIKSIHRFLNFYPETFDRTTWSDEIIQPHAGSAQLINYLLRAQAARSSTHDDNSGEKN